VEQCKVGALYAVIGRPTVVCTLHTTILHINTTTTTATDYLIFNTYVCTFLGIIVYGFLLLMRMLKKEILRLA